MASTSKDSTPAPAGYVAIHPKDLGLRLNPDSNAAHAAAFRAVLLYTLTYAFDLSEDEIVWTGYHLDTILAPLLEMKAHTVPFAVRQEMLDGAYTRLLELKISKERKQANKLETTVKTEQASLEIWVDTLLTPIEISYPLSGAAEAELRVGISGLLQDLGIGITANPRQAVFLPVDIRSRIFAERSYLNK